MGSQVSISRAAAAQQMGADATARAAQAKEPHAAQTFESLVLRTIESAVRDNLEPRGNVALLRQFSEHNPFKQ